MADPLYQAPSSDGKPPGPTPQLFPGNDAYNSQHTPGSQQHNGFPTTQSEGPIMQNNTVRVHHYGAFFFLSLVYLAQ